jgi:hypothetical protein
MTQIRAGEYVRYRDRGHVEAFDIDDLVNTDRDFPLQ